MKKMIRLIILLCSLSLIFAAAGCGDKGTAKKSSSMSKSSGETASLGEDESAVELTESTDETSGGQSGAQQSGAASNQSRASQGGASGSNGTIALKTAQEKKFASLRGTTLNVMSQTNKPSDVEKQLAETMSKKYGVTVKFTVLGWSDMQSKIAAMVASKTAPDWVNFSEVLMLRYVSSNIAQAIDAHLVKNDPVWVQKNYADFMTVNNKVYGIAGYRDLTYYVYYNKTLFQELKIKEPYDYYKEGSWNFANFRKAAKEATVKNGDKVETYGVAAGAFNVFLMANGTTGLVNQNGKWTITLGDKASMNSLQLIKDVAADGSYLLNAGGQTQFFKRECAMIVERPKNAIGDYDYYNRMKDTIGMAPMPKGPDVAKYYAPQGVDGSFVPLNVKNPLGAVAWMYELRKLNTEIEASNDPADVAARNKVMSKEHRAIRDEYMNSAVKISTNLDGLADWWDGAKNRSAFWNKLVVDLAEPSQVVDSMKSLMLASLKKTVGSNNVK